MLHIGLYFRLGKSKFVQIKFLGSQMATGKLNNESLQKSSSDESLA